MTIYFALLRGINVGGNYMIKMMELKQMFEVMGCERVQTYINSGNVMFESEDGAEALERKIEDEINKVFGFKIAVLVRTSSELARIIDICPFDFDSLTDGQSIHLTLLKDAPTQAEIDSLPDVNHETDEYYIDGKEIFFLYRKSMLDSQLPKKFQKLTPATSRNWKTVLKLDSMAKALKAR